MCLESDGKPKNAEKNLSSATFSITNPTWIDPGANQGLCGERPVTNDLSHGTAFRDTEVSLISMTALAY
jgi:hypothetical protein